MSQKDNDRKERIRVGNEIVELSIPEDAYWGPETALALKNFAVSGYRVPKQLVQAILFVKKAAAQVNGELNAIPQDVAFVITRACDEALKGKFDDQFVVDVLNSGAGTSFHMNVNEVIANRASEILGGKRGDHRARPEQSRRVDPHNHVNFGQSTNDVMPTAIRIASVLEGRKLLETLIDVRTSLTVKAGEFFFVKTAGRTHTKDALPVLLGERFHAYADRLDSCINHFQNSLLPLSSLGIGGSAVGTGANTAFGYRRLMIMELSELCFGKNSMFEFREDPNLFAAMSGMGEFAALAGSLRVLAIEMNNILRDLELMSSGPNTGIGEIILPSVQPGSSIMPGKVNPALAENLSMVCSLVVGNAAAIDMAAGMTQWELNTRMPLIGWKLIESMTILKKAIHGFDMKCVRGLKADETRCRYYYENTMGWFTLLNPIIGYEKSAELVSEVAGQVTSSGETILVALIRIAREKGIRTKDGEEITEDILERLAFPRF